MINRGVIRWGVERRRHVPERKIREIGRSDRVLDAMAALKVRNVREKVLQAFPQTRVALARRVVYAQNVKLGFWIHRENPPPGNSNRPIANLVRRPVPKPGKERVVIGRKQLPNLLQRRHFKFIRAAPNHFSREARHKPVRTHHHRAFRKTQLCILTLPHVLNVQARTSGLPDWARREVHQLEAKALQLEIQLRNARLAPIAAYAREQMPEHIRTRDCAVNVRNHHRVVRVPQKHAA
mmetsp:Transcript_16044/g.34745  ORF Transcript_16044/g.34745 Transcript_16044/m.34745 type:complete len:237 (-) Transcript_16044:2237-2947(-)